MPAYYSEFDPKAAAWLRELIKRGLIADGVVDERDLWDVAPADLRDFAQVHLCAGIGVWSYSLRSAGWSDDRPVWTGSFPCQPFSAAGKGEGFADERHLWPAGCHLIAECRPAVVFGEQVASKDADPWLDLVQADLEALDYAVGAVPFPSAGVGAPHIRDRLYWVADAVSERRRVGELRLQDAGDAAVASETDIMEYAARNGRIERRPEPSGRGVAERRSDGRVADADSGQCDGLAEFRGAERDGQDTGRQEGRGELEPCRNDGGVPARGGWRLPHGAGAQGEHGLRDMAPPAGPVNGLWRDADWLFCRDGKWRPVKPGTFPLAHGSPARVGRLRGYGNAINAEAAKVFIEAYLDTRTIEAGA